MVGVFAEPFFYADDLKLVTQSIMTLHEMARMCEPYAHKWHAVTFNVNKALGVIIYKVSSKACRVIRYR